MSTIKLNLNGFDLVNSNAGMKLGSIAREAGRTAERYSVGQLNQSDLGPSIRFVKETYLTVRALSSIPLANEAQHSAFAVFRDAIAEEAEKYNAMFQQAQQQQNQQAQLMSPQLPPGNNPTVEYLDEAKTNLLEPANKVAPIPADDDFVEIIDSDVIEAADFEVISYNLHEIVRRSSQHWQNLRIPRMNPYRLLTGQQ